MQDDINYEVAREREKVVRHDVMSHVYALRRAVSQGERASSIWELRPAMWEIIQTLLLWRKALKLVQKKLVNVIARAGSFC